MKKSLLNNKDNNEKDIFICQTVRKKNLVMLRNYTKLKTEQQ